MPAAIVFRLSERREATAAALHHCLPVDLLLQEAMLPLPPLYTLHRVIPSSRALSARKRRGLSSVVKGSVTRIFSCTGCKSASTYYSSTTATFSPRCSCVTHTRPLPPRPSAGSSSYVGSGRSFVAGDGCGGSSSSSSILLGCRALRGGAISPGEPAAPAAAEPGKSEKISIPLSTPTSTTSKRSAESTTSTATSAQRQRDPQQYLAGEQRAASSPETETKTWPAREGSAGHRALDARLGGGNAESELELPLVGVGVGTGEGVGGGGGAVDVRGGMVASLIMRVFHIDRHELKKFLYMSFMMFAIIYVFTMTR